MPYGATLVLRETVPRKTMAMLLLTFAVVFGLGVLAGCVFQCGWRQLWRRWCVRLTERPAVPTPASPPPPPPTALQPTLRARSVPKAKSAVESVRARGRLAVATTPGLSGALPRVTEPEMAEPPLPPPTPRAPPEMTEPPPPPPTPGAPEAPRVTCPLCDAEMTFKRARAGGFFHGCSRYPLCRGSRRPNFSEP